MMNRPYIFCHMMTSLDGKIMGSYMDTPEGDFVALPNASMYYVSVDPSGKLGWESSQLTYGDTAAHVLEVLTEKAGNAIKPFCASWASPTSSPVRMLWIMPWPWRSSKTSLVSKP